MKELLVFLAAVGAQLAFAKFPAYIEKCSLSDRKLNECALRSANKAMEQILAGDPEFDLPRILPVKLQPMHLDVTDHVHFDLTNGLSIVDDVTMTAVEFDFQQKSLFLSMFMSRVTWYVDYEARGTVQDRPLHEKGQANITYENLVANNTISLHFKTIAGRKYLEAMGVDASTSSTRYEFKPYNKHTIGDDDHQLLSGDQGQEVAALYKKSGLAIRREAQELANWIIPLKLNLILKLAPFDEIFLP